jgi:translation initiation factor IF-2
MTEWQARELRRVQAKRAASAGARPAPGRPGPHGRRPSGPWNTNRPGAFAGAGAARPQPLKTAAPTAERSAHKRLIKIDGGVRVASLAASMGVRAPEVLVKLLALGATGVHVNSTLDVDTAALVAGELGWSVENVALSDAERISRARAKSDAGPRARRAPVVTVMGHVDHGKTSLLDRIRQANVAASEAGGITQHIGAHVAETASGRITFIDTPGHAAFAALRARGARVTDVVVLVVAADDGLMPQTREAIGHAREAHVPIVVAINKMDLPGADAPRVRRELSDVGLNPEAWGGDTLVAEVSARTGEGIDDLLEKVLLQAELLGLEASEAGAAAGVVIEAQLDKGQGPLATLLVKDGTLRLRDILVVGETWGKVRALFDDRRRPIDRAGPSTPVLVAGLEALPRAGDEAFVVQDVAAAQRLVLARHHAQKTRSAPLVRATPSDLSSALGPRTPELRVLVKADADGSVEALRSSLGALSRKELTLRVVHAGVGAVTESDIKLAAAAGARLVGFRVDVPARAHTLARQLAVELSEHALIYELLDDVERRIGARLAPPSLEREIGRAEVRQVFSAGDNRAAGSRVAQGLVRRGARVRVERAGSVVWQGGVASLRRFKEDVREVHEGADFGIVLAGFDQFEVGDVLVASELENQRQAPLAALAS